MAEKGLRHHEAIDKWSAMFEMVFRLDRDEARRFVFDGD